MDGSTPEASSRCSHAGGSRWSVVVESMSRPYRVTLSMVLLVLLIPLYLVIGEMVRGRRLHTPELALDLLLPVRPAWAIVYGSLYLFLIVLPLLIVRDEELIGRTVRAYLTVWTAAYACFLAFPTVAPRPGELTGDGFAAWGLRSLYGADPPYNCFPSLHVAHSFVSAFACRRVHRGVGVVATLAASLVGLSTLYTKQHYVADVIAGVALASAAQAAFLRSHPATAVPELDRRLAPLFAASLMAVIGGAVAAMWVGYQAFRPS